MTQPILQIIIASTRPGRVGLPVAEWFTARAHAHAGFGVEVVDLLDVNLPFLDEPKHPMLGEYVHEHSRRWSAIVGRADAFVFVMPEYNHGFTAPLKNAIDYLHREWRYKPVGFVSYGGLAAGTRAVQMLKPVVSGLKMFPVTEAVNIPLIRQFIGEDRRFQANGTMDQAADALLTELHTMSATLAPLRDPAGPAG